MHHFQLVCSLTAVAWPPRPRAAPLTIAREARRPTRGIPEECADAFLACIYEVQSAVE